MRRQHRNGFEGGGNGDGLAHAFQLGLLRRLLSQVAPTLANRGMRFTPHPNPPPQGGRENLWVALQSPPPLRRAFRRAPLFRFRRPVDTGRPGEDLGGGWLLPPLFSYACNRRNAYTYIQQRQRGTGTNRILRGDHGHTAPPCRGRAASPRRGAIRPAPTASNSSNTPRPTPPRSARCSSAWASSAVARHRSKDVTLYRQGDVNFIVNAEPDELRPVLRARARPVGLRHRVPRQERGRGLRARAGARARARITARSARWSSTSRRSRASATA